MTLPEPAVDAFVTIDFETYYDPASGYTLSKMTTADYVRDPRFQVIGVGVQVNNGAPQWVEADQFREWAGRVGWSRVAIICHHTHFDGLILAHHFGVKPAFWLDTLSMGRALHGTEVGGSLSKLSKHYELGEKGNEVVNAKGKRRENFGPEEWNRYGEYCKQDVRLTYGLFQRMSVGFPEVELHLIDKTVRFYTEPGFVTDEPLLRTFLAEERQRKADLLAKISADRDALMSNDKFALLLTELGEEPPTKISPKKSKTASEKAGVPVEIETFAFSKSDPGFQGLLEHEREEIRWIAEARVGVKSTINETRTERLIRTGADGAPVPVYLKYAGAHTFRWSGGDRFNFQNLPRGGTLRRALLAPEGYNLVVADSGQIEARVLGWLAGHTELLDIFRRNDALGEAGDFYSDVGSTFFGKVITKKTHPLERQLSKNFVLGLGYGMGWYKFSMELAKGMLGAPPVKFGPAEVEKFDVDVSGFAKVQFKGQPSNAERVEEMPSRMLYAERLTHCAVADYFVRLYRERNYLVPALWREMSDVLAAILEDGADERFGPGGCLRAVRHGIVLPNGLTMKYPGLQRSGSGFSYMGGHRGKQRERAYGGSITENIVQALARIIVAEQLLTICQLAEPLGARPITTTHDELVFLVSDSESETIQSQLISTMRTPPDWCADLPLNASGGFARSYGDAK